MSAASMNSVNSLSSEGALIVLEGVDGVGKTTLIPRLAERLQQLLGAKEPVRRYREPGGTPRAEALRREILDGQMRNGIEALELFSQARESLVDEVLRPALEAGEVILLDRFVLATRVYQGEQGVADDLILERSQRALGDLWGSDKIVTVVLTLPEEELLARRRAREAVGQAQTDQFDRVGFAQLMTRQERYIELASEDPRAIIVDANAPVDQVAGRIVTALRHQGVLDRVLRKGLSYQDADTAQSEPLEANRARGGW